MRKLPFNKKSSCKWLKTLRLRAIDGDVENIFFEEFSILDKTALSIFLLNEQFLVKFICLETVPTILIITRKI